MRAVFGIVSLVVVLGIVALLTKKQLPEDSAQNLQQQSVQVQQQVKQQVEASLQLARPAAEEK